MHKLSPYGPSFAVCAALALALSPARAQDTSGNDADVTAGVARFQEVTPEMRDAIERGIDPADGEGLAEALGGVELRFDWETRPPTLRMDGRDISQRIREMDVSGIVSDVAKCPPVRAVLVEAQRQIGTEHPRLVSEGRDQGSIVFPDATVRFYLDADPRVRALRRVRQLSESGMEVDVAEVTEDIRRRDRIDSTRSDGPLICPEGAIIIDTSELEIADVVNRMVQAVQDRLQGSEG